MPSSRYDKTITSKVSIEQFDKLHNHATSLGKDVSDVLRDFIDGIDQNELEILKMIDYYEYNIQQLKQKLDMIKKKRLEEKEAEERLKKEEMHLGKKKKVMENVTNIASEIMKEVGDKFQIDLTSDDKEVVEKAKKETLKFIKNKVKDIDEEIRDNAIEKITHLINRLYFKVAKEALT
jgi:prefoldin subunit 5